VVGAAGGNQLRRVGAGPGVIGAVL